MKVKAVKKDGLTVSEAVYLSKLSGSHSSEGFACGKLIEPIPNYNSAPGEKVLSGENNTFIVFGRDRPASRLSGYGGQGHTQCGSIDIVAGRSSAIPLSDSWVDPNMFEDAARILLSQKTDVDENFKLVSGKSGKSETRSAIAMKADAIRIVARNAIKLITGTDPTNSLGGQIAKVFGIDLIAGNDDEDLQPLVLGDNLKESLDTLIEYVENIIGVLTSFIISQMIYNQVLAAHVHPSATGITGPSAEVVSTAIGTALRNSMVTKDLYSIGVNLKTYKYNYLKQIGKKYICSRHNNTN